MSAARERAGRALYECGQLTIDRWDDLASYFREAHRFDASAVHRASLDENDPALVEAVAIKIAEGEWGEGAWQGFKDYEQDEFRKSAVSAIIAARNHIIGEGS